MSTTTIPSPLTELTLSHRTWTVEHWLPRSGGDHVDLDAPYQRSSVWTDEQRRNLIRSLLQRLPVGTLTYAALTFDPDRPRLAYRVIDGKQRVEAVRAWAAGDLTVPGWWFRDRDLLDPADRGRDVTVHDLNERGERRIVNAALPGMEYDSGVERIPPAEPGGRYLTRRRTPAEVLRSEAEVYLLVNSAGTSQTDADLVNAAQVAAR